MTSRQYRAGQPVDDHCRQCHEHRLHTIVVVDAVAQPLRVRCDYCGSEHNYRGGPQTAQNPGPQKAQTPGPQKAQTPGPQKAQTPGPQNPGPQKAQNQPLSLVSDRERKAPPMSHSAGTDDLELLMRRIIREETGLTPVAPAEKWRGGELVLRPGKPGVQEKSWPIESFFHKVVMLRNRLRTLEQQVNASDLPDDQKLKIQSYITGCYGSLTSFNVLFADEDDRFVGAGES
jgi:hypothetical protein